MFITLYCGQLDGRLVSRRLRKACWVGGRVVFKSVRPLKNIMRAE